LPLHEYPTVVERFGPTELAARLMGKPGDFVGFFGLCNVRLGCAGGFVLYSSP